MNKYIAVGGFFAIFLVIGVFIHKDYGISWDEPIQRDYGLTVYNYITGKDKKLLTSNEKYYGPVFEVALVLVEKAFGLENLRDVYFARHFANFLVFYTGVFFFYLLLKDRYNSWKVGLFGGALLVLTPRIFAHAFYNPKDLPLLSAFIIGTYTLSKLLSKPSTGWVLAHAAACASTISIRIVGIILPAITILAVLKTAKNIKALSLFLFATFLVTVILWPTLWHAPLQEFVAAFEQMRQYPQSTQILYFGSLVKSTSLPWHYALGWMLVTLPVMYLAFFAIGLAAMVKGPKINLDYAVLFWLFAPLAAVIALKSVLYDEWRQLFFIYPAFLYVAIAGIVWLHGLLAKRPVMTWALLIAVFANMAAIAGTMIKLHPYENIYFNELAGNKAMLSERFDLDYWGLSYKQALTYIAANDKSSGIKVGAANFPGVANALLLADSDRARMTVGEKADNPNYYVTNYRGQKERDKTNLWHSIKVYENEIVGIYKLQD